MKEADPNEIELTRAEWQLLRALATGASNKQIARDLDKSDLTVRNQLHTLFGKIRVANRVQAVSWYRKSLDVTEMAIFGTSVPLAAVDAPHKIPPYRP